MDSHENDELGDKAFVPKVESEWEICCSCQKGEFEPKTDFRFDTQFCCEYAVRKSMTELCDKYHHPLQIKATQKDNPEKNVRAKIVYKSTHGVDRSKQSSRPQANLRTAQYFNYTGCTAQVNIRKQANGFWAVRTCILDHITSTDARHVQPLQIPFFLVLGIPIHFPRTSGRSNPGIVLGGPLINFQCAWIL